MLISRFAEIEMDDIIAYEDKFSIHLPDQFRTFLHKYNGGETPNTSFKLNGVSSDIKAFCGLGKVKYSMDKISPKEVDGKKQLQIALDSFGNEILIDIKSGTISFFNHENGKSFPLSSDFNGFICACESKPINPGSVKSVEDREKDLISKGRGEIITDALRDMWRAEINKYKNLSLEEVVL